MKRTLVASMLALSCVMGCGKAPVCRARQTEAKWALNALNRAEVHYREHTGRFTASMGELGFVYNDAPYYDVRIDSATATTYTATALGKGKMKGDVWVIDQQGNPVADASSCEPRRALTMR